MPIKPKYTDESADRAIELYLSGNSMLAVERLTGIDDQAVRRILDRRGIALRAPKPCYSEETKQLALKIYTEERISAAAVAVAIGIEAFTVKEWLTAAGLIRSQSEAAALSVMASGIRGRSQSYPWSSPKAPGVQFAASTFEARRMAQHDDNPLVASWRRCSDFIPYKVNGGQVRRYVPDLQIEMTDGSTIIEEVKPAALRDTSINQAKFAAAGLFYSMKHFRFVVVTEADIAPMSADEALSRIFGNFGPAPHRLNRRELANAARKRRRDRETEEQTAARRERDARAGREIRLRKNKGQITAALLSFGA